MKDFNRLDYFIQRQRLSLIKEYIPQGSYLLDIGCDRIPKNLMGLQDRISKGVGIDKEPVSIGANNKLSFVEHAVDKTLPFKSNEFDRITMLAVLEHLEHPQEVVSECYRVLKPGGKLVLTIPSYYSRPLLETLAFARIISVDAISTHLHYFKKLEVESIMKKAGLKKNISKYYNLFMNLLFVYEK
jgi:2-polyprenyl-3-methyl-5-hydroxy-6-metoxy-1,4-benzoquinol methylase